MAAGIGGLSGFSTSGITNSLGAMATFVLFMIFIAVIASVMFFVLRYNRKAIVFQERGGRVVEILHDRVREEKKMGNISKVIFFKLKKKLPPPSDDRIILKDKKGKDVYLIYRRSNGDLQYMNYEHETGMIKSLSMDLRMFDLMDEEESRATFSQGGGFIQKYGALIVSMGMFVLIFVLALLLLDRFEEIYNMGGQIISVARDAGTQVVPATTQ